nr:unnamed protein product [Naegleria fowleri]
MEVFDRILLGNKDDACDIHLFKEQNIGLVINVTDNIDNHFENKTEIKIKLRKHEQTEMMRSLSQSSHDMDELVFDEQDENITPKKATTTTTPLVDETSSHSCTLTFDEEDELVVGCLPTDPTDPTNPPFLPPCSLLKKQENSPLGLTTTLSDHKNCELVNVEQHHHGSSMTTSTTVSDYLLVPSQSSSSASNEMMENSRYSSSQLSLVSSASSDPMLLDSESVMSNGVGGAGSNSYFATLGSEEEFSRISNMSEGLSFSSNTLDSVVVSESNSNSGIPITDVTHTHEEFATPNSKKSTTPSRSSRNSSSKKKSSSSKKLTTPSRKKAVPVYQTVKLNHPIIYHNISIEDSSEICISEYFDDAITVIVGFLDQYPDRKVLIHCREGRSRSVSTLIAFGMKHLKMSLKDCYQHVTEKIDGRDRINDGFKRQLMQYELKLKEKQFIEAKREEHYKTNPDVPFNEELVLAELPADIHVNSFSFFNRNKYGKSYVNKSSRGHHDAEDDMDFDEEDEYEYEDEDNFDEEDLDDEDFDESYGTKKKKKPSSKRKGAGKGTTRQQKLFSKQWNEINIETKPNKTQGKQLSLMDMFAKKVKKVESGGSSSTDTTKLQDGHNGGEKAAKQPKQPTLEETLFSPKKPKKQSSTKKKTTRSSKNKKTSNKKDDAAPPTMSNANSSLTEASSDMIPKTSDTAVPAAALSSDNDTLKVVTTDISLDPQQDAIMAEASSVPAFDVTTHLASASFEDKTQSSSQPATTSSKKKKEPKKDQANGNTKKIFKRAPRLVKPEQTVEDSSVMTDEKPALEKTKNEAKKRKKDETNQKEKKESKKKKNKSNEEESKRETKKRKKEKKEKNPTESSSAATTSTTCADLEIITPTTQDNHSSLVDHPNVCMATATTTSEQLEHHRPEENKENILPSEKNSHSAAASTLSSSSETTTLKKKKLNSITNYFKPKPQPTNV